MRRNSQSILLVFMLAVLASRPGYPQDRFRDPRVVIDLEKPHSGQSPPGLLAPFGASCKTVKENTKEPSSYHPGWDKPISVSEWMGAPIKVVKVRRYGPGWKSRADVRVRIVRVLKTQSGEVYPYRPWDEAAFADIVATVQFSDHTKGALEVSGVHVCFCTHSGTVLWLRVLPTTINPIPAM